MIQNKKRKEVTLDANIIELLELQAKREGRKLKNFMEYVLCEKANDFQLTEDYKKMMDKTLDDFDKGNIKFKDWDAVKKEMYKNDV
ncbi:hypothetical protein [Polaribacter sp. Hel_I_88]|uniref:hypothetical protein n=1 Tax=Polaribacter sp. Hel_I_88 TaxID=1250006 RepID=UPI0005659E5E|nr:hypothetical protein [Polaribacter sp. Hel_I_88]